LILCVCAISKKHLKTKRKTLFDLSFFHLPRGKRRGRRRKTGIVRTKKEQYTHRTNSNLPGESIARKKGNVLLFVNRGKSPLFYKKQYQK